MNTDVERWNALIKKLKASTIPDHAEAIVELLEILKAEIEFTDDKIDDIR